VLRIRVASTALAVVALLACETRPHNPAAALAGASAQSIMLLPLNVAMTLPPELEGPSDLVWKGLERYLEDHGKRIQTVRFGDARRLWLDDIRQFRAAGRAADASFDDIAQMLVLELGRHAEFDAVIVPSLFIQQARLHGKTAFWDGVERRVEIDGDVRQIGSIYASTSLVGDTPGASLHVVILDASGGKLHEAQAGLELIDRMAVTGKDGDPMGKRGVVWGRRPNLFDDEANVREGVAKALDPFLPPFPDESK
jgi:hypothetical protein